MGAETTSESDLLYGVKAIAAYLGMRPKQAQGGCDTGKIPTFRIGRNICARKTTLDRWIEEQELNGAA